MCARELQSRHKVKFINTNKYIEFRVGMCVCPPASNAAHWNECTRFSIRVLRTVRMHNSVCARERRRVSLTHISHQCTPSAPSAAHCIRYIRICKQLSLAVSLCHNFADEMRPPHIGPTVPTSLFRSKVKRMRDRACVRACV